MIATDQIWAMYRWYYAKVVLCLAYVVDVDSAATAGRYALGCLLLRALKGQPTRYGPHHYVLATAVHQLRTEMLCVTDREVERISELWFSMMEAEIQGLTTGLSWIYTIATAAETTSVARLTLEEALRVYDPLLERWTDGYLHHADTALVAGVLRRAEGAVEDPEFPSQQVAMQAAQYADGEFHRHQGWALGAKGLEADDHGEQQAEVRDRRVPDTEGTDDQVARERQDRDAVPGEGARPGAHDADPVDD